MIFPLRLNIRLVEWLSVKLVRSMVCLILTLAIILKPRGLKLRSAHGVGIIATFTYVLDLGVWVIQAVLSINPSFIIALILLRPILCS